MSVAVAWVLTLMSLVIMAWAGALSIRNRPVNDALFYAAAALEVAVVAVVIGGFIALGATDRSVDGITFVGYLITIVLVLPIGVAWGASDKSRWGTGVVVIAAFLVIVLSWRLVQIWQGTHV